MAPNSVLVWIISTAILPDPNQIIRVRQMKKFDFAILSSNDPRDVIAVLTIHADSLTAVKKKLREDPDMNGVRFYPIKDRQHHAEEVEVAA